jgi:hypothetical protein
MVALGVGAESLYVVDLLGDDFEGYRVDEWPSPAADLWWTGPWENGAPAGDPGDTVEQLASALAAYSAPGAGDAGASGDHTVRLSTRNLLLAGIDLDFEVQKAGRKLGTLSVSEGGLLWRPSRAHRRRGRAKAGIKISWSRFAKWAES